MKRLKLFISLFCLAVSLPLAYVVWQTYTGLAREERGQMQFFCETLFDAIEAELASLVQREENRAVDEYRHTLSSGNQNTQLSPLAGPLPETYILGYLQNNPDGSFQTPMVADLNNVPGRQRDLVAQLSVINAQFNRKKFNTSATRAEPTPLKLSEAKTEKETKTKVGFAERYIAPSPKQKAKSYLGKKAQRTEEITADQVLNLSQEQRIVQKPALSDEASAASPAEGVDKDSGSLRRRPESDSALWRNAAPQSQRPLDRFQVEVAPLQSVLINKAYIFIFRRIAVGNQIYRQGFILRLQPFLRHLAAAHFESQPMAQFSRLRVQIMINGQQTEALDSGASLSTVRFDTQRTFPAPFNFMSASVQSETVPPSPARRTLNSALIVLGLFTLLGLFGIYQSARAVVALSERRNQFVSSVTHELKTPLTNIRMYIEMLEQGIAATPDREQAYFKILGSESTRLSRLINNVLELSKLEKKQRNFNLKQDDLEAVLLEVRAIMAHKLDQEGFDLKIDAHNLPPFEFDREVMVQVLINLLENSIKFGRKAAQRQIVIHARAVDRQVQIIVRDSGPGIPKKALKKIFDDFYRVDNDLTRTTGGTGIGLALVKKLVTAMGGTVRAANNSGPGCSITLTLPLAQQT